MTCSPAVAKSDLLQVGAVGTGNGEEVGVRPFGFTRQGINNEIGQLVGFVCFEDSCGVLKGACLSFALIGEGAAMIHPSDRNHVDWEGGWVRECSMRWSLKQSRIVAHIMEFMDAPCA